MSDDVLRRNNVTVLGDTGPPLVFAHGFGCDQRIWRLVVPAFAGTHRVVLLDHVGSGRSDPAAFRPERYASLDGWARDLLEVCSALDLGGVTLVGHSVGGMIGVLAQVRAPGRFARLVLVSSSARYVDDPPGYVGGFTREDVASLLSMMERNYRGFASFLAPVAMKNADRPDLARELEESFLATSPIAARRFAEATFLTDNRRDLPLVTVPALVLQCSDDKVVPLAAASYLRDHLPGSTLRLLSATGHYPQVSAARETTEAIREYLSAAPAPGAA